MRKGILKDGILVDAETGDMINKMNLFNTRFDGIFIELYSHSSSEGHIALSTHATVGEAMEKMEITQVDEGKVLGINFYNTPEEPVLMGDTGDILKEIATFLKNN